MRSFAARARAVGRETLAGVVARLAERGRPVTCVVYTFFVGWVPEVARASGVPSALFWIQPAAVFAVYYHYFHGHEALIASCTNDADPTPPSSCQDYRLSGPAHSRRSCLSPRRSTRTTCCWT